MIGFPLLLIPLAVYNIVVFLMPGLLFTAPLATIMLRSGTLWPVTLGDAFLAASMALLLLELIKAVRASTRYVTDHLLSFLVFCAAVAEFVLLPQFGTSTFFLLTVLTLVEFLAGIVVRRRARAVVVAAPIEPIRPPPEPSFAPPPAHAGPDAARPAEMPSRVQTIDLPASEIRPADLAADHGVTDPHPDVRAPSLQPETSPPDQPKR